MSNVLDLVIIGAGLSGIGAACRYVTEFPDGNFTVLEARDAIGGTWDLFRYPGIRSDSDMLTLGYDFRPWKGAKTLADGPAIRDYVRDTSREYGIDPKIQFNSRVVATDFSTADDIWTLTIETDGQSRTIKTRFILSCAGYYHYDKAHDPEFAGRDDFPGDIIHPQFWPEGFDYAGKRIAVIGSGATAATLVPILARTAAHVTQVQRTPSYVAAIPSEDPINKLTSKIMSDSLSVKFNRWKNIKLAQYFYGRAQANPDRARANIRKRTINALGEDYPVDTHFNPPYNPWDQRMCMIPDGDLFTSINLGKASIVTGQIDRFNAGGILMQDGTQVDADVIVTATGLSLNYATNYPIKIDSEVQAQNNSFTYKGVMMSGVPNIVAVFGYTNASWTLRADLMSRYVIRLIKHMKATGMTRVVPIAPDDMERRPILDFQAGYLKRVLHEMPSQGDRMPWLNIQNYKHDQKVLIDAPLVDEALRFSRADANTPTASEGLTSEGIAEAAE